MKRIFSVAMMMMAALAGSAFAAGPNTGRGNTVKIPFDFKVQEMHMPAGEYKIRNGGQTFAVLINRETGQAVHVLRVGEDSESRRLVFKRSKGERVLVNVG